MLVSDSTSGSEMDEAAVKKTPRRGPENGESNAQALIQRLQPNELQGRRIRLYRNGDRFFKGIWYTVIPSLRTWSAFLEDLQKIHFLINSLALPQGIRFIFNADGEPCFGLEDIRHGQSYVVASTEKYKRIDYANAAQPMWSFVSSKLSEPPKCGLRETFQREPNEFVKPRIITIIRNGIKPRRLVRHLLNKRTAQSFDMVISDITAIVKLNSGVVRKLYSISGKQVNSLADFFGDDLIFIAYGTERICCDDFYVISEEYKRMEIGKRMRPPSGHFRLRPTQLKMLNRRNQNSFQHKDFPSSSDGLAPNGKAVDVELPPDLRDKVRLMEVIGDGNTALVYRAAFREECGQWAEDALKIVRRETLENEEVLAFVKTEMELLSTVAHQQIVQLREWNILEGSWYIRMELLPNGDMFELLRKRRTFSQTEAASYAECLCRALDYLHSEQLIVHRDVKLENLLVYTRPEDGRCMTKLADFGLACRLQSTDQLLYQLCGTPTYVAPEVLAEFGYSFKADCWSVGIILFILLCGFPPFGVDEPDEVLFNRILRGQFHFPAPTFDSVSASAKLLICRLLNTDPNSRLSALDVLNWPWIKGLGECDELVEWEAEEQLLKETAHLDMEEEESNDFAISESSADLEFFFSRRASMDELSEPGTSAANHNSPELRLAEDNREFAQKNIKIELTMSQNGIEAVGKETPKVKRKAAGGSSSARGEHRNTIR